MENSFKFTTEELIIRLAEVIKRKERHDNYVRVNHLRELYTKLITGENMDSLMLQFTPRENKEMFEQRMRITQHITKTASLAVMDIFYKIPRSNSVQRNISYSDNDVNKLKELNYKLSEFWGDNSLDDYMSARWFELNFTDPNAFIVVEWGEFDNTIERAQPYPFEVSSKDAIQYEYFNNDLQYLVVKGEEYYWQTDKYNQDTKKEKHTYTIYGESQTIKFVQITDDKEIANILRTYSNELRNKENKGLVGDYFVASVVDKEVYMIIVPTAHNLGYVPALRVGVKRDLYTDGKSCVSPLDKAVPILMKIVKANSEFDLTMALHAFPQKIQYAPKCKERSCKDGQKLDGTGDCPNCGGTGFEVITSAQDVITIGMPKAKEEMLALDNLVHYVQFPVDLPQFQESHIFKVLLNYVKEAVFNSELFSKQEVSETATGKSISLQNIYDSLYPISQVFSKHWYFLVTTVADIVDLDENLVAFYNFSKDFKLKSLSDLYMDLKMVGDARASEFVKSEIEKDIAGIIYSEDERALLKYNVKMAFYPFSGKSPEEIKLIVASTDMITDFTKIFYANYGQVFDAVEMQQAQKGVDFYYLAKDKQWELIKAEVERIQKEVDKEEEEDTPELPLTIPNGGNNTTEDDNSNLD